MLKRTLSQMNRPRNRQPRAAREDNTSNNQRGPRAYAANVPTAQQVIPGSTVSLVLKADQPTGREVQGVVQEVLTRGDHPRGIKVRTTDGRIGRVQRMVSSSVWTALASAPAMGSTQAAYYIQSQRGDKGQDEESAAPPARTLADYMPGLRDRSAPSDLSEAVGVSSLSTDIVRCPICGVFKGDETAVSHHVQEHIVKCPICGTFEGDEVAVSHHVQEQHLD